MHRRTHSFLRLAGKVGTNLSFWVPCLVTSACFFARLPIALVVGAVESSPEPEAASIPPFGSFQLGMYTIGIRQPYQT